MTPGLLNLARDCAAKAYPMESCGLLVVEAEARMADYLPTRNLATEADRFAIHPEDWVTAEDYGTVVAVVHSHPDASPEPSEADRMACDLSGLPWVILGADDTWETIYPAGIPFEGRAFCWGVNDCYSLARNWYQEMQGVTLPDFPRMPDFWLGHDLFGDGLAAAGFERIEGLNPEPGDALLFGIRSKGRTNHCAVYLGNGQMLHHLPGRLSVAEPIGAWVRDLAYIARRAA